MEKIDVTVIVASYNPKWEKLKSTIQSIVFQKNICLEVIVADDGSKNNYCERITELLEKEKVRNFTFLASEKNQGTVKNVLRAVEIAKGKYIRLISPGDYLYGEKSLSEWYSYMECNKYFVSFGKGIYYNDDKGQCEVLKMQTSPKNIFLYQGKRNERAIRKNYLQLDDMALGAAFLTEKDIFLKYLKLICEKVRLGEDFLYKLMVFDMIQLHYYPYPVVWYEVGHGISNSKIGKYDSQMLSDWKNTNRVMLTMHAKDNFARKMQKYIQTNERIKNKYIWKIYKCMTSMDLLVWKISRRLFKSWSFTEPSMEFFERINR